MPRRAGAPAHARDRASRRRTPRVSGRWTPALVQRVALRLEQRDVHEPNSPMNTGQSSRPGSFRCSRPNTSRYHAIEAARSPTFSETWSSRRSVKSPIPRSIVRTHREYWARELRRRRGRVRPVHGEVLGPARGAVRGLRGCRRRAAALDVGCGPGALTAEPRAPAGTFAVSAVDPSESFVAAMETRHPEVDVRLAPAEELPFEDDAFDATLAQLVVHFMPDPVAGLREMARVTGRAASSPRASGITPAATGRSARSGRSCARSTARSRTSRSFSARARGTSRSSSTRPGSARSRTATSRSPWSTATFADWWEPYTLGVGPAGAYVAGLAPEHREGASAAARPSPPPRSSSARGHGRRGRP